MALTFPIDPTLNQEYVYGTITYIWNGTAWTKKITSSPVSTSLNTVYYNSTTGLLETSTGTSIPSTSIKSQSAVSRTVYTNTTILASDANTTIGVGTSSNPVVITLPSTQSDGFSFSLIDVSASWGINPVMITGAKIAGLTQEIVIDISGITVSFVYVDSTVGWTFLTSSGAQVTALLSSPELTGTPTVNSLPLVAFDPVRNSYVVGGNNITKMISPSTIIYDAIGRVKSYTSEGDTYTITYDSVGRVLAVTNGYETNTVIYDGANRVIGVTL